MTAEDCLRSGDLDGAMAALQDAVRSDSGNPELRIFLFQMFCVTGEWKRAITQLKLCAEMNEVAVPMAQAYREALVCEVYREKVFAGEKDPLVFGEPEEWMALLIEAMKTANADTRSMAFDAAPTTSGTLNGEPFEWVADADMRMGPMLEIIVNGRYFWMPFTAISEVTCEAPADLRDMVWMPAELKLRNGGDVVALIPTRYTGTTENGDSGQKLARATDWTDLGDGTYAGIGQRVLATDQGETGIMDLRELVLNAP